MTTRSLFIHTTFAAAVLFSSPTWALTFDFKFGTDFDDASQQDALKAAGRAWSDRIKDDVTIKVKIDWRAGGTPATADISPKYMEYSSFRDRMVADEKSENDRNGLVRWLPSAKGFRADRELYAADKSGFEPVIWASQANWKALGLDASNWFNGKCDSHNNCWNHEYDAQIAFTRSYYSGHKPGFSDKRDLRDIAVHELGHVLGFTSIIDFPLIANDGPTALDLFRFDGEFPKTLNEFRVGERNLSRSTELTHLLVDRVNGQLESVEVSKKSRKFQASHWRNLSPPNEIGAMDSGQSEYYRYAAPHVTEADLYAMDLIGWDIRDQYLTASQDWNDFVEIAAGAGDYASFLDILSGFHDHDMGAYATVKNKIALLASDQDCGNTILDCGAALDTAYELDPLEMMRAFQTDLDVLNIAIGDLGDPLLVAPWARTVSEAARNAVWILDGENTVPEPGTLFLFGAGLLGLATRAKKTSTNLNAR